MRGWQVEIVQTLFTAIRELVLQASECKKPDQAALQALVKPLGDGMAAIDRVKTDNFKARDWSNHFSVIGEGVPALGWVTIVRTPRFSHNCRWKS